MSLHRACSEQTSLAPATVDWHRQLPVLSTPRVTLRGMLASDAASLLAQLGTVAVTRHTSTPPTSVAGFERFIRWTQAQRRRGTHLCFAIVPAGETTPVGLIQIWRLASDFSVAEWGIAIGESYWGRGIATDAARLLLQFAFTRLRAARVEARAAAANSRGRRLMTRLGAVREGTLRHGFRRGDAVEDHEMWALIASEWRGSQTQAERPPADTVL